MSCLQVFVAEIWTTSRPRPSDKFTIQYMTVDRGSRSHASEVWQRTMEEEFGDVEGLEIIVDDLCIWGECDEDHDRRLESLFDGIGCSGVKLNRPKCKFGVDNVGYVGHVLSKDGLKPSSDRIQAIRDMVTPQCKGELSTFLGILASSCQTCLK